MKTTTMKSKYLISFFLVISTILSSSFQKDNQPPQFKDKLSEYQLFEGNPALQKPAKGVMPYTLNAPLFSDYAYKVRFVKLPDNQYVNYNSDSVFSFPVGTVIAKTFYYPHDFKNEKKGRRLLETRILIHEEKGWIALPYIWNDEQTEAFLEVAGGTTNVNFKDDKGAKQAFEYTIPNKNQCKGCHEKSGVLTPIGPSARQLNGDFYYAESIENQLIKWKNAEILRGVPDDINSIPKFVNYSDIKANINDRAKAYLDVNCAHCHNRQGPAQTSGLFLDWLTTDSTAYGFYKTPVAAGRGSGNLKYSIVPGKPHESILLYRMQSLDPGVMMPELGRSRLHTEGLQLIKDWISQLK
jgi:uncharacterized repeat protein (TIGR03806 family)